MTKFDCSDPTGWITQMEHYFSLYGITDDLAKLRYGVLHLDQERWQWWLDLNLKRLVTLKNLQVLN